MKSQISKGKTYLKNKCALRLSQKHQGISSAASPAGNHDSLACSLEYSVRAMHPLLPCALTLGLCHGQDAELPTPTQTGSFHIRWEMCWELPIIKDVTNGVQDCVWGTILKITVWCLDKWILPRSLKAMKETHPCFLVGCFPLALPN